MFPVMREMWSEEKKMEQKPQTEELTLEENFKRLDEILEKLQDPSAALEEAFEAYTEGIQIVRRCSEKIDLVEKKVKILNGEGTLDEL